MSLQCLSKPQLSRGFACTFWRVQCPDSHPCLLNEAVTGLEPLLPMQLVTFMADRGLIRAVDNLPFRSEATVRVGLLVA